MFTKLLFLIALALTVQCQDKSWKGLTPLKSSRADVEKVLGGPAPGSREKHAATYSTAAGRVFVLYSTGPCSVKPSNGWNVTEGTMLSLSFYPAPEPAFDESKIDMKEFEKRPDPEILSSVAYTNEKDGISITVNSWDNTITRYHYFPPSKNNKLKCESE